MTKVTIFESDGNYAHQFSHTSFTRSAPPGEDSWLGSIDYSRHGLATLNRNPFNVHTKGSPVWIAQHATRRCPRLTLSPSRSSQACLVSTTKLGHGRSSETLHPCGMSAPRHEGGASRRARNAFVWLLFLGWWTSGGAAQETSSETHSHRRRTRWAVQDAPLLPCAMVCREGRLHYEEVLGGCSIFTFGREGMANRPQEASLWFKSNATMLVHLVGSKPYFNSSGHFFEFLEAFTNITCPKGGQSHVSFNITSLCSGGEESPCVLYEPHGQLRIFPAGEYTLTFDAFSADLFPYAFWSMQYLSLKPHELAAVSVVSEFVDEPLPPVVAALFDGIFWTLIVACSLYFVLLNEYVGNKLVDLAARVSFIRPLLEPRAKVKGRDTVAKLMRRRQHTGKDHVFCLEWGGCVFYTNKTIDAEGKEVIGAYPEPREVLAMVASADDSSCPLLRECAKHVFSSGPEEKLAEWGNAMLCTGPGRPPDLSLLANLHLTNQRGVCGYSFKKGDICWNCRTCQTDGTCVQCDQCFRQSDHNGHEVYFHHASPGGCCDCGDLEAWKQSGCCPAHAGPDPLADPFEILPEAMRTPARVVMEEAVRLVVDTALHGVQGFNLVEHHPLLSPTPHTGWSFVRLHNDDIHSFQDVNDALVHHELQQMAANEISKAVDMHGHAQVKRDKPEALRSMLTDLATDKGLLASLVDEAQIKREERSVRLLSWLTELTHRVDGLSRLVATILTAPQPITLAQLGLEHGTRWYTPFMRVHQPKPDDPTLVLSSEEASVRLDVATRLTVLLAADFFVVKKMRTELHAMYLNLLIDGVFKPALAKELTTTYKLLSGLFSRGMGTGEDSVFTFTVQLYTTPSLVRWLSTIVEEDDRDPGLLSIITDSLIQAMRSTERWEEGTPLDDNFWEHHLLRHRRYNHIFRELDYCVQTPGTALAMLRKALPGPGARPLETWMRVLTAAQHADQATRRLGAHVDFETNLWTISFTFALALWQTSHALIVQAFKPSEEGDMDVDDDLDARNEALQNLVRTATGALQKWLDSRAVVDDALFRMSDTSNGHKKVDFYVHTGRVSFCVPLHRVLGMAIHEGATYGLQIPLSPSLPDEASQDMARFGTAVAEFPLRCLVLAAQVTAGLWRRNGMAIAGQAIHYLSLPFCRMLRDSDLAALQYSILLIGHESIVQQILDRYMLSEWVSSPSTVLHTPFEPRAFVTLAEEALALLIWLVTETPRPPGAEHQRAILRRELVHRLAARESTHSELHPDRSSPDLQQLGDPDAFDSMLEELSVSKRGSGGGEITAKFDLKPQAAPEYDGTFWHLTRQEHESAVERVVQKRASLQSRGPWPCVGLLPPVHPDFAPLRLLLYSPSVLSLQRTVLLNACGGKGREEKRSPDLLVRCIHLLTLQLHTLTDALKLEEAATRVYPPTLKPYQLSPDARPVQAFIGSLGEACDGADGPSMLQLLIDINSDIKACSVGPLHEEGLKWILTELSDRHAERIRDGGRLLENFRSGGGSGVDGEDGAKSKGEQAKRAQARALAFLQQQRSKFWEDQMDGDDEADDDNQQSAAVNVVDDSSLEVGAPACLYCHERTGGAMGYIGFAQRSTVLAHAISACAANKGLQQRYRCVPKEGKTCCVRAEPELHSPEVARLKRGTLMVVEEKRGRRLRISSPVVGWVSEYTANHIRLAEPLERYCFQQWGRQRLYVTMCGHAVHQDCWDAYYASVLQQLITEDRVDNRFALDVGRREFLCPLCKTLSNVLVPHFPGRFHEPSVPSPQPVAAITHPIIPSLASWLLSDSSTATSMTPSPPPSGNHSSSSSTLHAMLTRVLQADTQQGLPPPETLRASLGRFVDSLGEGWDVSWARLSIEGDASQRGSLARRHLLRDSYVAWSALGYSALLDVVNKQSVALVENGSDGGGGAGEDTATETFRVSPERGLHLRRLMAAVAQLGLLAESPQELREKVVEPLERVLTGGVVGRPESTSPRDVALRAMPLSLMLEHEIHGAGGTNDGRPLRRMRSLHKDRVASKEEGPLEAWPVFDRPLLAQDLTMLAVAVLSFTRTPEDACKAAAVLCLARLAQALMEPGLDSPPPSPEPSLPMNGVDTPPQPPPTSRDVALAQLASELGVHSVCVAGLERRVWGRWRPYLRTMLALLKAIGSTGGPGTAVGDDEAMDVDDSGGVANSGPVPSLLPRLGLPSAICDVEAAAVVPMFRVWAHQYRTFVDSLPFASAATVGTTTAETLMPASPQPPPSPMSPATAPTPGTSLDSSEAPGTPMAVDSASAGAAALEYHMTPFLSVVDGSVTFPDVKGNRHEVATTASGLPLRLYDLSHMGVSDDARIKLVDLPRHYTELYSMLKEQFWLVSGQPASAKGGAAMDEPALCLVCGTMMNAGPRGRDIDHTESREEVVGECTMHVRHCGAGHGVMLLINKGSSVIFRESRAAFYLSVYVDQYGEEDVNLRRGRPLYLSRARKERLVQLYRQHAGATETARIRASADRVIRDSYY